ncbi:MAG TPA: class I SAM-dependent methyltransferase [Gallionellaceae bacterium]
MKESGAKSMKCSICGNGEALSLGKIPDCGEFAGQQVAPPIKGGELWRCKECGSMFRYPTLTADQYLALYQAAPGAVWEGGESRRNDYTEIYAFLQHHSGGAILDIGCHAGGFLAGLPNKFTKSGVEPSKLAAESAASKNINILGKTLDDVDAKPLFDVVVAIDVIEHVLDVEAFLRGALAHANKGGLLIISTGDPESFYWRRVFKSRFWYSSYPEHLAFPSYRYFYRFAQRYGLEAPEQIRFKYVNLRLLAVLSGFARQFAYAFFPALYFAYLKLRRDRKGNMEAVAATVPFGGPGIFTDHQLIIFRKRDNSACFPG